MKKIALALSAFGFLAFAGVAAHAADEPNAAAPTDAANAAKPTKKGAKKGAAEETGAKKTEKPKAQ
jgi:hypothetical protein